MSRLHAFVFVGLAVVSVGIIFNVGGNLILQEVGAVIAILFAIVAGVLLYTSDPAAAPIEPRGAGSGPSPAGSGAGVIEVAFLEGPFGRERIAATLDTIERVTVNPTLPGVTPEERDRLWSMRPAEIEACVNPRLEGWEEVA